MINKEQIKHIADLSKFEFSDDEFAKKLQDVIKMEEMLRNIDTTGVEPTTSLASRKTLFREDIPETSETREELFKNVPETDKGLIKVPSILETEGDN
ncbi:Asp-tRNA(Asn)/Glu-tRNA(Gln) amidotransferase subunit GatC [Companilactobacillus sp. DQM5]|uniref:Asp-tRNA(Asn)/Glu-tRNA(Gln) amidotransferase subunit GatC n=1 Tax=Companilactobacillus sp. DQM5 TaxID=3463359 RepID=UPI0040594FCC